MNLINSVLQFPHRCIQCVEKAISSIGVWPSCAMCDRSYFYIRNIVFARPNLIVLVLFPLKYFFKYSYNSENKPNVNIYLHRCENRRIPLMSQVGCCRLMRTGEQELCCLVLCWDTHSSFFLLLTDGTEASYLWSSWDTSIS